MFSVTLISAPGLLDASLLENLRNAWGGGDALWLAPDEAAEFSCAALPENRWQVWQDLQGMQVEWTLTPGMVRFPSTGVLLNRRTGTRILRL